ncbi:hypothetical protein SADUNF_Sadunf16G0018400 [Salix dunnii]|uniref:BAG domain-containing protein n=1 Tax=Salix dunnii TaxID=1413687 RepID=A0A835MP29_9ROSI|nr:hypothetical protein SADUNF_Sadunf16G0018400 [Salix dunnii]
MNPSSNFCYFSSSTATITYSFHNDHSTPTRTTEIPITPPSPKSTAQSSTATSAATRIQSCYRTHMIRTLYKKISAVSSEADQLQNQIQRQETVDAIRSSEKEKLRMNEALMGLLLRLDSVPGVDPTVREARRKVSRRIVGLQEILDSICEAKVGVDGGDYCGWQWGPYGGWDRVLEEIEEEVCMERGGEEMEKFCAQYLGFRCLQRSLLVSSTKGSSKLILSLVNNLVAFGGKTKFVKWAKEAGVNVSSSDDSFFTNPVIKIYFKAYIKAVVKRKNSLSGIGYSE